MGDWEDVFGSWSGEIDETWDFPFKESPCENCSDKSKCHHCPMRGDFDAWAVRNMRLKEMDSDLQYLGKELIKIKEDIRKLQKKEKEIKSKIKSSLPKERWILVKSPFDETKDYIIEKVSHKPPSNLKKDLALKLIEKESGKELADLINEQCSYSNKYSETIYVRPYLKKRSKFNRVYEEIDISTNEDDYWS